MRAAAGADSGLQARRPGDSRRLHQKYKATRSLGGFVFLLQIRRASSPCFSSNLDAGRGQGFGTNACRCRSGFWPAGQKTGRFPPPPPKYQATRFYRVVLPFGAIEAAGIEPVLFAESGRRAQARVRHAGVPLPERVLPAGQTTGSVQPRPPNIQSHSAGRVALDVLLRLTRQASLYFSLHLHARRIQGLGTHAY